MSWDERTWNRYLRNVRSALVKRDTLLRGSRPGPLPESELQRERSAWAAKAKANLRRLAALATEAPDRPRAEETVSELASWFRHPAL
ncbi:MAG TPA: hypothetical protein VKA55_04100 [Gammaproteobacteria bacterium]|nr:hypothetical protein [Gammaproteobacteria bacterium]